MRKGVGVHVARQIRQDTPRLLRQHPKTHRRILSSVATSLHFQSPTLFRAINIIKKETKLCVIVFHKVAV